MLMWIFFSIGLYRDRASTMRDYVGSKKMVDAIIRTSKNVCIHAIACISKEMDENFKGILNYDKHIYKIHGYNFAMLSRHFIMHRKQHVRILTCTLKYIF